MSEPVILSVPGAVQAVYVDVTSGVVIPVGATTERVLRDVVKVRWVTSTQEAVNAATAFALEVAKARGRD